MSQSIAVLHVGDLDDQILALPALRALQHLFPGQLKLALGPGMRFMFARDLQLKRELRARFVDRAKMELEIDKLGKQFGTCERFINLSDWLTDSVLTLAERVANGRSLGLRPRYKEPVQVYPDAHVFDRLFAVAQRIDPTLEIEHFARVPRFSLDAEQAAEAQRKALAPGNQKLLFVHNDSTPQKSWPLAGLNFVLQRFLHVHPEYRVLVCSRTPVAIDAGAAQDRVTVADTPLEQALALVGRADLFLGVDSLFLHAADLSRVPGVSLFGPTRPAQWGFRFSPLASDLAARGRPCAMDELAPERVLEALLAIAHEAAAWQASARSDVAA